MAEALPNWAELPLDLIDRVLQALARQCESVKWFCRNQGPTSLQLNLPRNYSEARLHGEEGNSTPESSAKRERHKRRVREAARQQRRNLLSILGASQVCRSWREAACRRTARARLSPGREHQLRLALATLQDFARRRPVLLDLTWDHPVSRGLQPALARAVAPLRELRLWAVHPGFLDFFGHCPALTSLVLRTDDYSQHTHLLHRAARLEFFLRGMPCLKQLTLSGVTRALVERRVDWVACLTSVTRLSLQLALWNATALGLPMLLELDLTGRRGYSNKSKFLQEGCLPAGLTALSLKCVMLEERPCFAHIKSLSLFGCQFTTGCKLVPRSRAERQQGSSSSDDDSSPGGETQRSEACFEQGVCDLSLCTALTRLTSRDGRQQSQPHLRHLCGLPPGLQTLHLDACFQGVDVACLLSSIMAVVELDLHICCEESYPTLKGDCSGHQARHVFPLHNVEQLAELPCLQRLHLVFWEDSCSYFMSDNEAVDRLAKHWPEKYEGYFEARRYKAALEQVRQAVVGRGGECVVQVGADDERDDMTEWEQASSWDSEGDEGEPAWCVRTWPPQILPSWSLGRPAWCMEVEEKRNRAYCL